MVIDKLNEFYKGKKVLVTGHTGFKGGWLSIWLEKMGANVIGYSLDPIYQNGIYFSTNINDRIIDYRADIRNKHNLEEVFELEKPVIVFHLAAQALVLESYNNPLETLEINIQGTANLLEEIRKSDSVKSSVIITTDKVYENKEWVWAYRENDSLGGHDPYSASKGASEIVIKSYYDSFLKNSGTGIVSVRAGNVIGGGDWSKYRIIPDIINSIKADKPIELRKPNAVRPWQHVLEPLFGYLLLGMELYNDSHKYSGSWNFGPFPHNVHSVKDLTNKIIEYLNLGNWIDLSLENDLHESNLLMLDINKSISLLNWMPKLSFEETIKLTVDWYFNTDNTNLLKLSHNQIDFYESKWK